jgi:hypothetical protein
MADLGNIGVRSPYFISETSSGAAYGILEITINSTLRYTIRKDVAPNTTRVTFDVAELIRDYIDPVYDGSLSLSDPNPATVSMALDTYQSSGIFIEEFPYTAKAYDGYGYFADGNNFTIANSTLMLSSTTKWLPDDYSGSVYATNGSGTLTLDTYQNQGATIKRFGCEKYGYVKCVFINKFGVHEELFFFGKLIEAISSTKESYKSNITGNNGTYSSNKHQVRSYNAQGKTSYTLNTGFVGEEINETVKQLMLSEQVWLVIDSDIVPVMATSSSATFKTSLNDKMVDYTIDFEQANDLISSVR